MDTRLRCGQAADRNLALPAARVGWRGGRAAEAPAARQPRSRRGEAEAGAGPERTA